MRVQPWIPIRNTACGLYRVCEQPDDPDREKTQATAVFEIRAESVIWRVDGGIDECCDDGLIPSGEIEAAS
ncbi:MAG: hypothetical protein EOQ41_00905 [Mesorhizobium sp.]|nr:MAG: hypothetical protein EOQ41_00905 [Mesorhizobium sp.]